MNSDIDDKFIQQSARLSSFAFVFKSQFVLTKVCRNGEYVQLDDRQPKH